MTYQINKVGIIGAGTMGAGIAAHLANTGIEVVLLDIVTPIQNDSEVQDDTARNRFVAEQFQKMVSARPSQLGSPDRGDLVRLGNVEDDFGLLTDCDWVIEVIIEQLAPKQALMAQIDATCNPAAIISSNTSGIPIHQIVSDCSDNFKKRFLGTHFFNPPRYMKLLEIIPTADTDPEIVSFMQEFGRDVLGKGVIICKDTPNFVANRIGTMTSAHSAGYALANDYTVAEVDELLGSAIGRPKTGLFRLGDLIGVDVRSGIMQNLYHAIADDDYRDALNDEALLTLYNHMVAKDWRGNKSGQGFYKKVVKDDGKREFWTLNLQTLEYQLPDPVEFESLNRVKHIKSTSERIAAILEQDDRGAQLIRDVIFNMLAYSAYVAPFVAYSLADIDQAVRWGFNHEMGPFELWDALGVEATLEMMEQAELEIASWVTDMLVAGHHSFYQDGDVYDFETKAYQAQAEDRKHLTIANFRKSASPIEANDSASLHDMGDSVLLFEFHSKVNALDFDIFDIGYKALERLKTDFSGLVIGNEGRHFSVGANLGKVSPDDANALETAKSRIRYGQEFMMALRRAPKPIVTALHGRALGGGAEIAMQGWTTIAHHELMIGLVEFYVGLVPAWTGCKELLRRTINPVARQSENDVLPVFREILGQLMSAKVSQSAWEAIQLGYLRDTDKIIMNANHRLYVAKQKVLELIANETPSPEIEPIYAAGKSALDVLYNELDEQHATGKITAYDEIIGRQLAIILCGGDSTDASWVDPWHILDLERDASLEIRQNPETLARIDHMLTTGKPLRN